MKVALSLTVAVVSSALDSDTEGTPVGKCMEILKDCEAKVIKEGEEAQKVYAKFAEWCEDRATDLQFEVKTSKGQADGLSATVFKETSNQQALSSQIEDIAADIATDEKDLAAATKIRKQETADFQVSEKDLVAVTDTLDRAIAVIEREMASGGASMMQLKSANSLTQVLKIMVQATTLSTSDAKRLTAFVQSSSDDDDMDFGAPASAVYESQSGGVVDVLEGLRDQANEQLDKIRKAERSATFNYQQLKQSLDDSIKYANADLADAKKSLAASQEAQATAQGDLDVTKKVLAADSSTLADLHRECLSRSEDFESEAKSRAAEMKGLAIAKKAVANIQLRGVDKYAFLQISLKEEPTRTAVHVIRNLAREQNDPVLAQLASRMNSVLAMSNKAGEDPFAKIKEMLLDSIQKIHDEQAADATQKAYCDKEMAEAKEKVADKKAEIEKHTTKIEQKTSASIRVKEEVAALQEQLAKMNKAKFEADTLRQEEKADYDFVKGEVSQSLEEIKYALKVLRDFYGKYEKSHEGFSSSDGASDGVIALLETVEADFEKALAQGTAVEEQAVAEYNQMAKTYETDKVITEQGIKYKTKEHIGLDKYARDETSDRDGVQSELDANSAALSKLEEMCIAKPDTYEDRVARREAEITRLKETLEALEEQTSFVQRSVKRFRGGVRTRTA